MKIFLLCFSIFLLVGTLIPLIKKEYWVFRIFEYPRLQKLVANVFVIVLWIVFRDVETTLSTIFLVVMGLNAIYLLSLVLPFTRLSKKQVLTITNEIIENGFSLMIANVYQDNTNYKGCLKEISKTNPDLVLLLETDSKWEKETAILKDDFPYSIKVPLENTYGMLLYSKLALEDSTIKYLVEDTIPSIHTKIVIPNKKRIQLYAVHPTPPVPTENPTSMERDKELLLIADLAKESELPVVVIGDLNDVAWSFTTKLFLKMSGLLDPRRGRGFFNTFHAHYPFLRFPLDHAFISVDLKLKKIKRLNNFSSDHFPMFISLQYEEKAKLQQEGFEPDADDIETANQKKQAV
ncbi:endonuclease/exonuclease/phosphatase family protein [Flavobacterium ardleyense]|uniref:Endonuclease/exonuclease/phosphatase family protein n=1 Tax=Flavobacterium ardleyense TaxID=2038737 RepID=A0ABW5Z5J2_9FLAO